MQNYQFYSFTPINKKNLYKIIWEDGDYTFQFNDIKFKNKNKKSFFTYQFPINLNHINDIYFKYLFKWIINKQFFIANKEIKVLVSEINMILNNDFLKNSFPQPDYAKIFLLELLDELKFALDNDLDIEFD